MHNIADSVVEAIGRMRQFSQFGRPARAGAVEDDFDFVAGLQRFVRGGEGVEDAAERFFAAGLRPGRFAAPRRASSTCSTASARSSSAL